MTRTIIAALTLGLLTACAAATPPAPATGPTAYHSSDPPKLVAAGGQPGEEPGDAWGIVPDRDYSAVVEQVVGMVSDPEVTQGASARGLSVVNVAWEDAGRAIGSSLGPNISDLSLQVRYQRPGSDREERAVMPVIRFPNFTDRTGDVRAGKFLIRAGNHANAERLRSVPLTDVLRDIRKFASRPESILGSGNLLAKRDTHFLVSAQAVFLPIPKQGKAEFNPVLFNYQSAPESPAVLAILVTRQGASMTVIENRREDSTGAGWGQELYFNNEGQRAAFTAERKSDVEKRIEAQGGPQSADDKSALAKGADSLFLIQVPLRHHQRGALGGAMPPPSPAADMAEAAGPPAAQAPSMKAKRESDVEQAVLGHGQNRGPFNEGNGLRLVRDEKFPIRITVQFYNATSNGVASEKDLDGIAASIGGVYEHADFVGSLVLPADDPLRPTEWQTMPREWFPW